VTCGMSGRGEAPPSQSCTDKRKGRRKKKPCPSGKTKRTCSRRERRELRAPGKKETYHQLEPVSSLKEEQKKETKGLHVMEERNSEAIGRESLKRTEKKENTVTRAEATVRKGMEREKTAQEYRGQGGAQIQCRIEKSPDREKERPLSRGRICEEAIKRKRVLKSSDWGKVRR